MTLQACSPDATVRHVEAWRKCWQAFSDLLSSDCLLVLAKGLAEDSTQIIQGGTTCPPPLVCVQDWPVEGADPVAYAVWQGEMGGNATVGDIEVHWAHLCYRVDEALGEPAGCRHFLCWWDDTPRQEARLMLLAAVNAELRRRKEAA